MQDCYRRIELYRARAKQEKVIKVIQDYVNSFLAAFLIVVLMSIAIMFAK